MDISNIIKSIDDQILALQTAREAIRVVGDPNIKKPSPGRPKAIKTGAVSKKKRGRPKKNPDAA